MAALINVTKTTKGKPSIRDKNHFYYVKNGQGSSQTNHWRCANRQCNATLKTRKSTENLVGETLPTHAHGNQLLKEQARNTENEVLAQYAAADAVPSTIMQEISSKMLSSNFHGQLNSASTAGAIRTKLWRQRQIINPRPKLPSSLNEYMSMEIPTKYTNTADGQQFMILKDWVNPTSPLVVFMSDWATELMRLHKIWLFDGTFKTAPPPFSQVNFLMYC